MFKGYIDAVFSRLGISKFNSEPVKSDVFAEGIALTIGNDTLVEFGTIKKSILKHFDIKQEVLFADFNWALLLKLINSKVKFTEIPRYPEVRRDLALLLDDNVTFEEVYKLALQTEKALLKKVNLFDVYTGSNLPEGKKSYAVSFTIQDNAKTLTDEQIDKVMQKMQKNFTNDLGAIIR